MKKQTPKKESLFKRVWKKLSDTTKLILTNAAIAAVDIFCFSQVGLGLSFSSPNALNKSMSFTVLIMSIILFGYANSQILFHKTKQESSNIALVDIKQKRDSEYYINEIIKVNSELRFTSMDINLILEQYKEYKRKLVALKKVIDLNDGRSADLLMGTAEDIEVSLAKNFRQILTKLVILDYNDAQRYERKFRKFIKEKISKNEEILDLFDELLDEVSRMEDKLDFGNIGLLATIEALKNLRGVMDDEESEVESQDDPVSRGRMRLVLNTRNGEEVVWVEEKSTQAAETTTNGTTARPKLATPSMDAKQIRANMPLISESRPQSESAGAMATAEAEFIETQGKRTYSGK